MLEFFLGYFTAILVFYLFDKYFIAWIVRKLNKVGLVEPLEFDLCYEEARIFYYLLQQRDQRNEEYSYSELIQNLSEYLSQYRSVESSGFNLW